MNLLQKTCGSLSASFIIFIVFGCTPDSRAPATGVSQSETAAQPVAPDPLSIILVRHEGESPTDREIRKFQDQVRRGSDRSACLERLGWAYVSKAHESFDPGFYKLGGLCADILETDSPGCAEGLLLRGYVLNNLHRFKEAETLARDLAATRGLPFDFGLLGDTLMEQGRLKEAVEAYQQMVNLRPDLQSYSRIAHVRWLTGDLAGAIEMMQDAVSASSPRDAGAAAWVNSRLATLQLHSGDTEAAQQSCDAALELRTGYPPALLLRGKMALQQENFEAAIPDLQLAAKQNPLPEYQWILADTLRTAGREAEAAEVEAQLLTQGAVNDPRGLSLYLSTRGEQPALAVQLAEQELQQREDVHTHDALAWALVRAGRLEEAQAHMDRALAEGTPDARLFFHAAMIESGAGHSDKAEHWFTRAVAMTELLLPSERALLLKLPDIFAAISLDADDAFAPFEANPLSASGIGGSEN